MGKGKVKKNLVETLNKNEKQVSEKKSFLYKKMTLEMTFESL